MTTSSQASSPHNSFTRFPCRSFAIELAKAWIGLAEYEERKELVQIDAAQVVTAGDGTILLIAQSEMGQPPGEHLE